MPRPASPSRTPASAEAAEHAFYAAMAAGDLDRMMALWVDGDEAVCSHPGGPRLIGPKAIRGAFREIFANGGVRIDTTGLHAWRGGDVAVHSLIERITVRGREGTEVVDVLATNVFVRSTDGWRMLMHHAAVADLSNGSEDAADESTDDDAPGRVAWPPFRVAVERDDDDDAPADGEPGRPPRGRLH